MKNISLSRSLFDFLKDLSKNNNREWFNKNKERYIREYENMIAFAGALLQEMKKHDTIETTSGKDVLFRIYRDTRFSKDKTPYKTYWAGSFKRATKKLRGGYYFQIEPGGSLAAGGFLAPIQPIYYASGRIWIGIIKIGKKYYRVNPLQIHSVN